MRLQKTVSPRDEVLELDDAEEQLFFLSRILAHRWHGREYQWLTLMEGDKIHEVEWQSTTDFVHDDEKLIAALKNYIEKHGILHELLANPGTTY